MEFYTLVEDIVYEHKLPISTPYKSAGKDALDLAGGETIDLSHITRNNVIRSNASIISNEGLHAIDESENARWRVTFDVAESNTDPEGANPARYSRMDKPDTFKVIMDFTREKQPVRTRIAFSGADEHFSYTSKSHNIIIPPWMTDLAKYKIT